MMPHRLVGHCVHVSLSLLVCGSIASAAPAVFTLDTPNSFLTIGGNVAGSTITQQGAGSLRTTYSGEILANLASSTIELVGGTADANVSGSWQPLADGQLGSAPADYGGKFKVLVFFDAFFAIRDLAVSTSSPALALEPSGNFDSTGVTVTALRGGIAYNAAILSQVGAGTLDGSSGANQSALASNLTITRNATGADAVLFIPAEGAFVVVDPTIGTATLTFSGQSRATAATINGDTNFDRTVDIGDFAVLGAGFNQPGSWLAGDFTGDGTVGIGDFSLLAANFNQSAPSSARGGMIPEPASVAAICFATGLLSRRRR